MLIDLEYHINLLKVMLKSYITFNDVVIAKSFDIIFSQTTKDFKISRYDLYNKIINWYKKEIMKESIGYIW